VIFTIDVTNEGREKAVDARVIDSVPEYLEVVAVRVEPSDEGQEVTPRNGQTVVVDVQDIGQGEKVTIFIRTRVRQDAPPKVCVENLAEFRAPNCPDQSAAVICTLPETGAATPWWMVVGGLGVCALVLGLALAKRV
jgi:LPXTG-motif cell wall-anchored protein